MLPAQTRPKLTSVRRFTTTEDQDEAYPTQTADGNIATSWPPLDILNEDSSTSSTTVTTRQAGIADAL